MYMYVLGIYIYIINIVTTIVYSSSSSSSSSSNNDTICMLKYINSCGNIIYCMAV
jgi:hypothetical protein